MLNGLTKLLLITFTLLLTLPDVCAQISGKVIFCLSFQPQNTEAIATLTWQGQFSNFPAKDTCISLKLSPSAYGTITIEVAGYQTFQRTFRIDSLGQKTSLAIAIKEKVIELKEVKIKPNEPFRYKGDTLVIRTDSIQTRPFAPASQLLERVPGVMVGDNGQVTVMGKNVEKITVDGKPIFGGNPKATLEVLRSEMVQQLEVTDNAGQSSVNMNIKLKADKKQGQYGSMGVGLGTYRRYALPVQYNVLNGKRFFSSFFNANNTNERLLSEQQETWFINKALLGSIDGAYSISDLASQGSSRRFSREQSQNLPSDNRSEGVSSATSGGLNYSTSSEKQEWIAFAVADHSRQLLLNDSRQTITLGSVEQTIRQSRSDQNDNTNIWSAVNGTLRPNDRNSWRLGTRLNYRRIGQRIDDDQTIVNMLDTARLVNTSLARNEINNTNTIITDQQVAWTHRPGKPAQVLSAYASHSLSTSGFGQTYQNQWRGLTGGQFSNDNLIDRTNFSQAFNGQLVYAQPIARRWLAEWRGNFDLERNTVRQEGFQYDSTRIGYELARPDLGIGQFTMKDQQQTYSFNTLFKGTSLTLRLGAGLWDWRGSRKTEDGATQTFHQVRLLPQFYAQYKGSGNGKVELRYNLINNQVPYPRLFPVVDSSNVQLVRAGNSGLQPYPLSRAEVQYSNSTESGHLFSAGLKYEYQTNPVLFSNNLTTQGFIFQTFRQGYPAQQANVNLFWTKFTTSKPYNVFLFAYLGWQQNNIISNQNRQVFDNYFAFLSGNLNWKISKKLSVKSDFRANTFRQQYQKAANSFRGDIKIKAEYNWSENTFLEVQNTAYLSFNATTPPVSYHILNLTAYHYFLASKRLRASLTAHNLLNVENDFTNYIATNTRSEQFVNRMPRYVMLSLTFYADKWKKGASPDQ